MFLHKIRNLGSEYLPSSPYMIS